MDKDYNPKIFDWSGDWLHILYFTKMHDIIAARICTISKYEANYLYARNRYKTRGMTNLLRWLFQPEAFTTITTLYLLPRVAIYHIRHFQFVLCCAPLNNNLHEQPPYFESRYKAWYQLSKAATLATVC
jgi:hypothetical protein